jgi:DNA-binding CsgD family transcriptional regulator
VTKRRTKDGAPQKPEGGASPGPLSLVGRAIEAPRGLFAEKLDVQGDEFLLLAFPAERGDLSGLTSAEQEVASELLQGRSYQEIARQRGTTSGTVANQVRSIFRKIGVRSRSELARKTSGSGPNKP